MKQLCLLNQDTNIKLGDTDTQIQFSAFDDNQPVSITSSQSATFRIKNSFGFLKSVDATTTYNGSIYQLDTAQLTGLVPGVYQIELAIYLKQSNPQIYPDEGFCQFTITPNALSVIGEQLPVMSLDDFKKDVQAYVNNQLSTSESDIKNSFNSYVQSITDSTVNQASQAVNTANQANDTANQAKTTAQSAVDTVNKQAQQVSTNASNLTNVMSTVNSIYPAQTLYTLTNAGKLSDLNNLPFGLWPVNGWVSTNTDIKNYPDFAKSCWGLFISLPIGQEANKGNLQIYTANNTFYTRTRNPGSENFGNWVKLGEVTGVTNLLLNSLAHNDSNWATSSNGANSNKYRGSNIDVINAAWNGVGPKLTNLFNRQVVNTNDFYTFSIYVKTDPGVTITNDNMYFFNADNTVTPLIEPSLQFKNINSNTWYQLQVPFKFNKLQPPASGKDYIRFELSQSIKGNVYFSCPKLERGVQASDYAPSPEDYTKLLTQSN